MDNKFFNLNFLVELKLTKNLTSPSFFKLETPNFHEIFLTKYKIL